MKKGQLLLYQEAYHHNLQEQPRPFKGKLHTLGRAGKYLARLSYMKQNRCQHNAEELFAAYLLEALEELYSNAELSRNTGSIKLNEKGSG